jgi:TolB protein
VLDPISFLEPTVTQDEGRAVIPCDNWRGIGADALVEGSIAPDGSRLSVGFRLWDVPRCRSLGGRETFTAPRDQIDLLGRRLADEFVLRFTGRRGVAATQIAFVSDQGGSREIYLMEADGSGKHAVTRNGSINLFPTWSPRGDALLYTSYRGGDPDLFVLSRGKSASGRFLDASAPKYRGVYSPDGDRVAVVMTENGNTDIYITDRRGRRVRPLTRSRSIEVSPAWSPDGQQIAFVSDRSGSPQI